MTAKRRPTEVFISYAHKDRKHLETLREHLAGLERSGRISCWWDGLVEVGKPWAPQIVHALHRARVVLLLLTAHFIASDDCVEQELRVAREREKRGQTDLVPILVEAFDLKSHWLGQLQVITVNGKSIVDSRRGAAAWVNVVSQVRVKVECMDGGRPVLSALNEIDEVVNSGEIPPLPELARDRQAPVPSFPTVGDFWRAKSMGFEDHQLVTVRGTLSQFAPIIMGAPHAKRRLHREFRKAIETHRSFGERKRLTINACMSLSAGQMVQRAGRVENRMRLLGLYESIVRNSIPVFVLPEFYERELLPIFKDTFSGGSYEATVTGRLFPLKNWPVRRYFARQGLDKILPAFVIDDLEQDAWALQVGGPGTEVQQHIDQPVRYVDGDIWLAVRSDDTERFVTAFVDIANAADRDEEMQRLREETQASVVIEPYDEVQSIAQLLANNEA